MNSAEELAAPVRSILAAARARGDPEGDPVAVSPRSFQSALEQTTAAGRIPIIAEVKPTSPTTNGTRDGDPVELAREMVEGGATALSVLTEPDHFGGSVESLRAIRGAVDVPVLRKDFVLREAQLDAVEADIVLLIARFVDDLAGLHAAARERGFQVLVEVHSREELDRALDAGAETIGINNRDLAQLTVDLSTFERIAPHVPNDVSLVAESGVSSPTDVRRMVDAGADALLVGTAIMGGDDVTERTRRLVQA